MHTVPACFSLCLLNPSDHIVNLLTRLLIIVINFFMTNEHRRMPSKIALEPTPTPPRRLGIRSRLRPHRQGLEHGVAALWHRHRQLDIPSPSHLRGRPPQPRKQSRHGDWPETDWYRLRGGHPCPRAILEPESNALPHAHQPQWPLPARLAGCLLHRCLERASPLRAALLPYRPREAGQRAPRRSAGRRLENLH